MKIYNEIWINIEGYDGDYQISDHGRVRSFKNGPSRIIGINNKPAWGYIDIQLCKKGVVYHHKIHRLVANHFCDKPLGCDVVNHLDGDKINNHYKNLEWTTPSGNQRHAVETGLRKTGGDLSFSKIVNQFDMNGEKIKSFRSVVEAGCELSISRHNISQCCRGVIYSYKGFRWSYSEKPLDRNTSTCLLCKKELELTRSNKIFCDVVCKRRMRYLKERTYKQSTLS